MNKTNLEEAHPPVQTTPRKVMASNMGIYYSNCAIVGTSPRDISIYFGRYVPRNDEKGHQELMEVYERQIYMTIEQAEHLVQTLAQSIQVFKSRRPAASD